MQSTRHASHQQSSMHTPDLPAVERCRRAASRPPTRPHHQVPARLPPPPLQAAPLRTEGLATGGVAAIDPTFARGDVLTGTSAVAKGIFDDDDDDRERDRGGGAGILQAARRGGGGGVGAGPPPSKRVAAPGGACIQAGPP